MRRAGNGPKTQYETIDQGGREQRLGRPEITRAIELSGSRARDRDEPRRCQLYGTFDLGRGAHSINMRKRMHAGESSVRSARRQRGMPRLPARPPPLKMPR